MTDDPIILSAPRKSTLRQMFRTLQREQGSGIVVAFANANAAHVKATLVGLAETNSITEPIYTDDGYAVVKTIVDENAETEKPEGEDVPEEAEAAEDRMSTFQGDPEAEAAEPAPELDPPPTSGPGSGATAWRSYASERTGTPIETWAKMSRAETIAELKVRGIPVG